MMLYVSNEGNDTSTGKAPVDNGTDGPFLTLQRAKDEVRAINGAAEYSGPISVIIRGGTYYLDEPLVFASEDGGTRECPVTYTAYPGEHPVISGGKEITGEWTQAEGEIMSCPVDPGWYFRVLTVNGERKQRARTPNEGNFLAEEAVDAVTFRYAEGDMESYANIDDAEVVMIHSWNETRLKIDTLDPASRTVICKDSGARHTIGWSGAGGLNRYYVENTREGLDSPGEWFLDRSTSTLYYWPEEEMTSAQCVAPKLRQLIRLEGSIEGETWVDYLRFEGITFSDTDWDLAENGYPDCGDVGDIVEPSTIAFTAARFCEFRKNTIRNTGTYGLEINGFGNIVEDNEIKDTGGGGIITRNYHEPPNIVAYNHIHHCGHAYASAVGINIDEGGGSFHHNLVHDIPHSGIYARHWATDTQPIERRNQEQELRIEDNEIYDVATVTDDAAGVFIRDSNIIIRNNLIHDVHSGGKRCPGWGIYLGCETRDTLVERNLVYNCLESLHVWYYDRNITVTNNIFVGSEQYQINFGNPEHLSHENIRIVRNIIYCTNTKGRLFTVHGKRSLPVESDYNVLFSAIGCVLNDPVITRLEGVDTFNDWRGLGLDAHSITADPLFNDLQNDDYTLKPESPAFRVGFQPLDFSNVGLRSRR